MPPKLRFQARPSTSALYHKNRKPTQGNSKSKTLAIQIESILDRRLDRLSEIFKEKMEYLENAFEGLAVDDDAVGSIDGEKQTTTKLETKIRQMFLEHTSSIQKRLDHWSQEQKNNRETDLALKNSIHDLAAKTVGVVTEMKEFHNRQHAELNKCLDNTKAVKDTLDDRLHTHQTLLDRETKLVTTQMETMNNMLVTLAQSNKMKSEEKETLECMKALQKRGETAIEALSQHQKCVEAQEKQFAHFEKQIKEALMDSSAILKKFDTCHSKASDTTTRLEVLAKEQSERIQDTLDSQMKLLHTATTMSSNQMDASEKCKAVASSLETLNVSSNAHLQKIADIQEKTQAAYEKLQQLDNNAEEILGNFKREASQCFSTVNERLNTFLEDARRHLQSLEEAVTTQEDVLNRCNFILQNEIICLVTMDKENDKLREVTNTSEAQVKAFQQENLTLKGLSAVAWRQLKSVQESANQLAKIEESQAKLGQLQTRSEKGLDTLGRIEAAATQNFQMGFQVHQKMWDLTASLAALQTTEMNILNKVTDEMREKEELCHSLTIEAQSRFSLLYDEFSSSQRRQDGDVAEIKWKLFEQGNELRQLIINAAKQSEKTIGLLRLSLTGK